LGGLTMSDASSPILVWFRNDLRLADHPALEAALSTGRAIIPVFIWAPEEEAPWQPGAASRWWLHHSLVSLDASLRRKGSRLVVRQGPSLETLLAVAREMGARKLVWCRRYEPAVIARDTRIKEALRESGLEVESFNGSLLHEPWTIRNKSGKPFQVFTPFWKTCLAEADPESPRPTPPRLPRPKVWPESEPIEALGLLPSIRWDLEMGKFWHPGEAGADKHLERFVGGAVFHYTDGRNRPDQLGTSRLSPHLHFGEITPRQIWHRVRMAADAAGKSVAEWRGGQFLAEVGWREFAHHLLFHFPHTPERPLRADFEKFPWRQDAQALKAWERGRTGIPLVDAGMRELWATGWMHNRVRMVVGSLLVKNLLLSWQEGARWFWDTLVDADLASNTLGWQWIGGCGADAAPYFRVFNPVSQGLKFDPDGAYVRRWVPELARMPADHIHAPWEAPAEVLRHAGVILGTNYPEPIISLSASRIAALAAFSSLRPGGGE
jgi:deoxyribodipyrimidine photo-lyase